MPTHRSRLRLAALATPLAAALILGLGACSSGGGDSDGASSAGGSADSAKSKGGDEESVADRDGIAASRADTAKGSPADLAVGLDGDLLTGRDVIRTADLSVVTKDVDAARGEATALVDDMGGVVAGETTTLGGGRASPPDGAQTVRLNLQVPTERFDAATEALSDLGTVRERDIRLQDVTAEVADVDSRVDSARTSLERVRSLLTRANKLGAVIRLESVLADRQADLEALQARQRTLAGQTTLATLRLELTPTPRSDPPGKDDDLRGFAAGIAQGWDTLRELVVGASTVLGVLLPFATVAAVALVPVALLRRRRGSGPAVSPPTA